MRIVTVLLLGARPPPPSDAITRNDGDFITRRTRKRNYKERRGVGEEEKMA